MKLIKILAKLLALALMACFGIGLCSTVSAYKTRRMDTFQNHIT